MLALTPATIAGIRWGKDDKKAAALTGEDSLPPQRADFVEATMPASWRSATADYSLRPQRLDLVEARTSRTWTPMSGSRSGHNGRTSLRSTCDALLGQGKSLPRSGHNGRTSLRSERDRGRRLDVRGLATVTTAGLREAGPWRTCWTSTPSSLWPLRPQRRISLRDVESGPNREWAPALAPAKAAGLR